MRTVVVGALNLRDTAIQVSETVAQAESGAARPELLLSVGDALATLSLTEVRALKSLMAQAEKKMLHRQEQAVKAKNLVLDF